jgi:hypothetical protein
MQLIEKLHESKEKKTTRTGPIPPNAKLLLPGCGHMNHDIQLNN